MQRVCYYYSVPSFFSYSTPYTQQPIAGWMYFRLFFSSPFYPPPPSKEKNSGALCIAADDDDDDDGERLRTVRPSSIGNNNAGIHS